MLLPRSSGASRPWPSVLVTWGDGAESELHRHHAWQLIVALEASLRVRDGSSKAEREGGAVLVHPDALHALDARGGSVLIAFVEPESAIGTSLASKRPNEPVEVLDAEIAGALRAAAASLPESSDAFERALALLGAGEVRPPLRHPGVRRTLEYLKGASLAGDVSLTALAKLAGLSEGRFMHAFSEDVGIPLRRYVRWLKLERAALAIARGAELSVAAHEAGFADAAHMTRSFREMYGTTPSELRRRSQSVQEP